MDYTEDGLEWMILIRLFIFNEEHLFDCSNRPMACYNLMVIII